uniref:Amine oxidase domain-containing protein n=1 Tax=viral metagenome TaxID=1070528 RepID=A0A6C0HBP1_9ZZZZ
MKYEYIILGGGVAGLYTAYHILKKSPNSSILILEKENHLGGRIHTFSDKYMTIEAGAGRFHEKNILLFELLRELGLASKINEISSSACFAPVENPGAFMNSILDRENVGSLDFLRSGMGFSPSLDFLTPIYKLFFDMALGKQNIPNAELIFRVIVASKGEPLSKLQNISFLHFAKEVLTKEEIDFIAGSFGYYSELVIMNAADAIYLMEQHLTPTNQFYGLRGGLSQIIENLENKLLKHKHIKILTNRMVKNIHFSKNEFTIQCENLDTTYIGEKCICAVPNGVLQKFSIFHPVKDLLNQIDCQPLCRIYSQFPKGDNGAVWFKGLPKLTTNNDLRMVIPIDEKEGILMSSYTDNKFARGWNQLYEKEGEPGVNRRLVSLLKESTGRDVPLPIKSHVFYWDCGVGYWGVGANSAMVSESLIQPMKEMKLFICGEPYSQQNQQWIEGALETSQKVIDILSL